MAATAAAPPPPALRRARGAWVGARGAAASRAAVLVLTSGARRTSTSTSGTSCSSRRAWDGDALLGPHNEHLSVVPVLIYKMIFSTAGIESYVPFRVAGLLVHLIVARAAVRLRAAAGRRRARARRRGRDAVPRAGVARRAVAVPDGLPRLAGGGDRGAARARPRRPPRRHRSRRCCSRSRSPLVAGDADLRRRAVEILGRPDRRARWWCSSRPAVLYGIWYLAYGGGQGKESVDNLLATPAYIAEAAAGAVGAVFGLGSSGGGRW